MNRPKVGDKVRVNLKSKGDGDQNRTKEEKRAIKRVYQGQLRDERFLIEDSSGDVWIVKNYGRGGWLTVR